MNFFVERTDNYVPSLDGLRAFAVLAVIAYHMKASWAPGGLLGVTMFFVLSGYLITGLLIKEYQKTGTISLSNFWLRRVRRIIPAVVFAVLGTGFLCTLFNHALLTKMRPDVIPTLLFVNNWWQIFHEVSYFVALGDPSPLTHYWSLAIEEQFYLIWPVALLVCMKAGVAKKTMRTGTIVLAALSALEMFILFDPAQDPSRVYYGTDTRAFSLLIGATLAFIWPYQRLTGRAGDRMTQNDRIVFNVAGVAAVAGLIVMIALTNGFTPFIYRGGLLICSLLTALLIAVAVHPASWIGTVLRLRPLVWVGKCSYSMYLWHYPIILLMTSSNMVGDAPLWLRLIQLAIIFGVSAFSYYVVEDPIRKGAIGKWVAQVRAGDFTPVQWAQDHLVPVVIAAAFVVVPACGLAFIPDVSSVGNVAALNPNAKSTSVAADNHESESASSSSSAPVASISNPYDILLIGDSVPEALEGYEVFYEVFPYGHIDAMVGRYFGEAIPLYQEYKDAGAVGKVVVIALGTNGYVPDEETEALMDEIGDDQRVWFINTRSHTEFVEESNAAIQRCVDKHKNAQLIDWYNISGTLGEDVFDGDGTHLTPDGCREYAQMIMDAVGSYLPEHSPNDKTHDQVEEERAAALEKAEAIKSKILHALHA